MNRNRDDTFKTMFEKLINVVSRPEFANDVASNKLEGTLAEKRFIKLDKEEKVWLTRTEISKPYVVSPKVQALTLCFEGTNYFSMTGLEPNGINLHKDLPLIEPNAGLMVALLAGPVPLRAKIDVLEIIDSILPQYSRLE